jgi:phosphocarrier protein
MESDRENLPETKVIDGFTTLEATVVPEWGLYGPPCTFIVREAMIHKDRDVSFEYEGRKVNAKSIMALLSLAAAKGSKINVYVRGDDEEAKRIARRFYSGLTTDDRTNLNFDRFEDNGGVPKVKVDGGFTEVEGKVGLVEGLDSRACASLAQEYLKCDRDVYLEGSSSTVNMRESMALLTLGLGLGACFKLRVSGDDGEARKIALRLYSGLTYSLDSFSLDFSRFEGQ